MNKPISWRRSWLAVAVTAVLSSAALAQNARQDTTPPPAANTKPIIGILEAKPNAWNQLGFVYVREYPFDAQPGSALKKPPLGPTSKTIFQSPEAGANSELPVGQLIHLEYQPTFNMNLGKADGVPHYHEFYEWGYTLKGDSIMPEPVSPNQHNGMLYRKKEGGWLSRPPYSLHGGSWNTGGMRNQLPYNLIIFEEGDGHVINVGRKGEAGVYRGRDGKGPPAGTVGDYRQVKQFTRPWLLDTVRDVEWEEDPQVPGRFVKWLDDATADGFRSQLVKIPPGWTAPPEWQKTYFENANRMRYMVWGDMKVWQFKDANDAGKAVKVTEDYFIYQPPRSIWGYGSGSVSERGAIWLEVTYAKGLKRGGGPIEDVKRVQ